MLHRLTSTDRNLLAIGVVLAVIVFFVSLNIVAASLFTSSRLDLTEDSVFTLSEGTKEMLAGLDEPIELRFYRSKELDLLGPFYSSHAQRVGDLLEEYAKLSQGKLRVETSP